MTRRFTRHKYQTRHHWELRGPRGGVHFPVSIMDDDQGEMAIVLSFAFGAGMIFILDFAGWL